MKLRQGFVSNSSSTSFCAYGVCIDFDEIKRMGTVSISDYDKIQEAMEKVLDQSNLDYAFGEEYAYIGLPYEDLKDNETGKQFKERAMNNFKGLKKYLDLDPLVHEDDFEFINTEVSN